MPNSKVYDAILIGAGQANKPLAAALVEREHIGPTSDRRSPKVICGMRRIWSASICERQATIRSTILS